MAQQISAFPRVPLLTDEPEVFDPDAVTFNLFLANTFQPQINTLAAEAEADAASAEGSATAAADSAALSEDWATSLTAVVGGLKGARGYAQDAAGSATSAANSATAAATSATSADSSATDAANSASASATSETNAASSATAAATSETNALESENKANEWAESPTEVGPGQFSAKYWAEQAADVVADGVISDGQTSTLTTWSSSKISGELDLKRDTSDTSFPRYDLASAPSSATLNLALSQVFRILAVSDRTLSFVNAPGSGRAMTVVVHLSSSSLSSRVITWPSEINWADGEAPVLDGTKATVVLFWTGIEWIGTLGALS